MGSTRLKAISTVRVRFLKTAMGSVTRKFGLMNNREEEVMGDRLFDGRMTRPTRGLMAKTKLFSTEQDPLSRLPIGKRWHMTSLSKMLRFQLLLVVALFFLPASSLRAQSHRIKLAVIGISNPSTLEKSNIGNALVDILDSDISTAGKYTLLERSELNQLKKELNLGQSDLANAKSFAQKGGLAGADFLLLGKVSDYTYKELVSRQTVFVPGRGMQAVFRYDHIARVRVDLRVVDVATGEDVRSVSGNGVAHNMGRVSFEAEWNSYLAANGQATLSNLRTLLTNASNEAIQDAVRQLNDMYGDLAEFHAKRSIDAELAQVGDGKILASLGDGRYVIGVSSTANLRVGDRFQVISDTLVKNSQGVVVYREKHTAGTLQVTDISESNRAMARLVDSPAAGSAASAPQENDTVVFDMNYAKSLRGLLVAGSAGGATSGGGANAKEVQAYVRRGNRFFSDGEYSEALGDYRQALHAEPSNPRLLADVALAETRVSDFTDAEADAEKAIAGGGWIRIPIAHNHMMGFCHGSLIFQRGKVSYQPTSGDHGFTVVSSSQITLSPEVAPTRGLPALKVQWLGQDGKEHKYDMFVLAYLTRTGSNGAVFEQFRANGDAAQKTARMDRMIVHLVKASLP